MADLGPFLLEQVAGRGGMGVVWQARHRVDGTPVAIKLVDGDGEIDEVAFLEEARAVARLHHPHVVQVFDYGRVPESGAPYLVMELLPGGSLLDIGMGLDWTGVRTVLLVVLDALAHAHARGLLHRDIKPANILRDADGGWRLVDFGISRAADRPGKIAGTLAYMAPEALQARTSELGPWTDLYGLGCVAWQLLTGMPPHHGTGAEILSRVLAGTPPLRARFPVPAGVEGWLQRMLSGAIEGRYERAADAAWALAELGHAARAEVTPTGVFEAASTFTLDALTSAFEPALAVRMDDAESPGIQLPPCPAQWTERARPKPQPRNLGLGLFGLRQIPFAGRGAERSSLWEELAAVHTTGSSRLVWITGPPGSGKTRLASWLGERADELGVALLWRVGGDLLASVRSVLPLPGATPALRRWLSRRLGLSPEAPVIEAWMRWLDPDQAAPSRSSQISLVAHLLRTDSARRPVVVVADDASDEALELAERVVEDGRGRVLFLFTSREPTPPESLPCRVIALGGLPVGELRRLVHGVIGVEDGLAVDIANRASGSPKYVHDVLASWVERGLLVVGPSGFQLAEEGRLPADSEAAHQARLRDWLGEGDPSIELAAVLGAVVSQDEWARTCAAAGVAWSAVTVSSGIRRGLLFPVDDGWGFSDAAIHEAVLSGAAGRLRGWHRAVAEALDPKEDAARVGVHLLAAGDAEAALDPLREGARVAGLRGDLQGANRLFGRFEEALELLGRGAGAPAGDSIGWRAWNCYSLGEFDQALELAARALQIGEAVGDEGTIASAQHTRGVVRDALGLPGAAEALTEAAAGYARAGQTGFSVSALLAASVVQGDATVAVPRLEALLEEHGGHPFLEASVRRLLALSVCDFDDFDRALDLANQADAFFTREGLLTPGRACKLNLGDILVLRGEFEAAEGVFRQVLEQGVDDRDVRSAEAELAVGLLQLRRGDYREAAVRIRRIARRTRQGSVSRRGLLDHAMLAVHASEGNAVAFDEALAQLVPLSRYHQQRQVVPVCEIAARVWEERGDPVRRERALRQGILQAKSAGRAEQVARLEGMLEP